MKFVDIYQTIEDRNNDKEVLEHGPYFCSKKDSNGNLKQGIKEPWLGEGYYFWDSSIEDAKWWGDTVYFSNKKDYIICHTKYDQHSPLLYDLIGDIRQNNEFISMAEYIKKEKNLEKITVARVLDSIKKLPEFTYKAIRAYPYPTNKKTNVVFQKNGIILLQMSRVQLCFFDKTLLTNPYTIKEKATYIENQTI